MRTRSRGPKNASDAPALDGELSDTQRRILTAALDVFAEKGFAGASTAEIAARAGVAEKTIFANYGSKQALLVKTLTPSTLALLEPQAFEGLFEALRPGRSLRDLLTALVKNRVSLVSRHPNRMKLVLQEAILRPEIREGMAEKFRVGAPFFAAAFRDLQERGELRSDLPIRTIMRTLMSTTLGLSMSYAVLGFEADLDLDAEINNVVDLLVSGLSPRTSEAPKKAKPVAKAPAKPAASRKR